MSWKEAQEDQAGSWQADCDKQGSSWDMWFSKAKIYCKKIAKSEGNSKELFQIASSLLYIEKTKVLPSYTNAKDLANKFVGHFSHKISEKNSLHQFLHQILIFSAFSVTTNLIPSLQCLNRKYQNLFWREIQNHIAQTPSQTKILKQIINFTSSYQNCKQGFGRNSPASIENAIVTPLL